MSTEFVGYFDDSGHPDSQPAVIIAGHVAKTEQWSRLEREWTECLTDPESGRVAILHMTDLMAGRGEFSGWIRKQKTDLLEKLVSIIRRRVSKQFSIIVPMDEYKKVNDKYALEEAMGTPYGLAGRTIFRMINEWRERYGGEKTNVRLVFEDGSKHKGDPIDITRRDELPAPEFGKKTGITCLQTADLLAWAQLQWMDTQTLPDPMSKLLLHPRCFEVAWAGDIERNCTAAGIPLRSRLKAGTRFSFVSSPKKFRFRKIK